MIDVIVPIYNAYADARACVESVLKHTPADAAVLWLIDDASTDPRIGSWLDAVAATHPSRVRVLHQPSNSGFVQTVNRGMTETTGDVVLLNSDTLVTPGWLGKLHACAYSQGHVATVSPWSNHAEICSYPVFCGNTRVRGLDLSGLCEGLDAAFDGTHPELPTTVGFCMYIRRAALDALGLFDAERFGKGYGEENDFCWRARNAGWVHLLCSNAWVSHVGGQSFSQRTSDLKKLHLERLLEKHPDYSQRIAEFVTADPLAPYRQRIQAALARVGRDALGRTEQPAVLLVTHGMGGGIASHIDDLCQLLGPHVRVEVLRPAGESAVRLSDTLGNERWLPDDPQRLTAILQSRRYARIHIHHLHGYSLTCAQALWMLGPPVDVTVHDFGFSCPQYNLSLASGQYCGEQGVAQCTACLAERPHAWGLSIEGWRSLQHRWLQMADRLIAPSEMVARKVRAQWPDLQPQVMPHPARHEWLQPASRSIRIGLIGGLSTGKGLDVLVQCAAHVAVHALPIEFNVIGYTARRIPVEPDLPIRVLGQYDDAALPRLLQHQSIDCIWLPSVIPESYSYTLDAAWLTNLPVIASHASGALAARLAASERPHRLVPADSTPADWIDAVKKVLPDHPAWQPPVSAGAADHATQEPSRVRYRNALLSRYPAATPLADAAVALPLLDSLHPPQSNALQAPKQSLQTLLEQGVDCGHAPSLAVLRQRVKEIEQELQALDDLAQREGRPWFEHLDQMHAERASLFAERGELQQALSAAEESARTERDRAHEAQLSLQAELAERQIQVAQLQQALKSRSEEVTTLQRQLTVLMQVYTVRLMSRVLALTVRASAGIKRRAWAWRRTLMILQSGWRRWPVAVRILRTEGPRALVSRVRAKLSPVVNAPPPAVVQPVQTPSLAALTPLTLPTCAASATPRVSIIIPVYGQHAYTFQCLKSLVEHTHLTDVEVIVIDDASPEPADEVLRQVEGVRWLRNPHNLGFVRTCNRAAEQARGEFVVLLNNDVQVTSGWLSALLDVFDRRADAGMVGAKLIYPDGRLQEAGGIVWRDGSAWNWGRLQDPSHPAYQTLRPADYCSGACLALRTTLWRALGGFDTAFAPAYYEDTDLAFRVRQAGLQVYYQPACQIIHHEGVTSGTDETRGVKRHQVINQATFIDRWRSALQHWQPNGVDALQAVNRWARKRMLIVEACMITPDQDSGSVRMLALLRILVGMGVHVTFVADNLEAREPYTSQLRAEGVEVWHSPYVTSVKQLLQERGSLFDVVMLCRHYIAAPLVTAVRQYAPQAQLWFDTVDLHYLREQRLAELEQSQTMMRTAEQTREQEQGVMRASDLTLVVSPVEQAELAKALPETRVRIVSNIHDVQAQRVGFAARQGLLFVGGFQHPPNIDAVQWFVTEVWPQIRLKAPDMVVRIVGSKMPDTLRRLAGDGVEMLGFVEDIEPLLQSSRLSIAPLRYGAGVKGKVNQAMAHGLPVVATPMAVEGMGLTPGENVLVAASANDFADAVLRLYSDEALWNRLAVQGLKNVEDIFSSHVARQTLQGLLFPQEQA